MSTTRAIEQLSSRTQVQLKQLVREELVAGVPDFALRQASESFVEDVKRKLLPFVRRTAKTPAQQREMLGRMNAALESLTDEIHKLLQDRLFQYTRGS